MSKSYKQFITDSTVLTDKNIAINSFKEYAINKLLSMFEWENLPNTIPAKWLEYYLLVNGNCFIMNIDSSDFTEIANVDIYNKQSGLYAVIGGLGGEYDIYYQPTTYVVANHRLNKSFEKIIDVDGVLVRNDSMMLGIMPILNKYGSLLTECDLTIRCALINMRLINGMSASDDNTKKSADEYIQKITNGEISVIGSNPFFDGIKPLNNNNISGYMNQIIEMTQYIKASFYNEIGLNANYNLKREYISERENLLSDDILLPLIDNMLAERKKACEKINDMFGTAIGVHLNSSWETNATENDKELAMNDAIINEPETDEPETDEPETDEPETDEPETDEPETDEPEPKEGGTDVTE